MEETRPLGRGELEIEPAVNWDSDQPQDGFLPAVTSILQFNYPLHLLIPEDTGSNNSVWVYLVMCGGGIVEGDIIEFSATVNEKCCLVVTTQTSTKVFHCLNSKVSRQTMRYTVMPGSMLCVLPDPTVCFTNAIYHQKQVISMSGDANLVLLDWLTAGRMEHSENWKFKRYSTCSEITLNDKLVFRDALVMEDRSDLSVREAMGRYQATGICVLLGPRLKELAKELTLKVGRPPTYGVKYDPRKIISVSSITSDRREVIGCKIQFSTYFISQAYEELDKLLNPLYSIIGANPFQDKLRIPITVK